VKTASFQRPWLHRCDTGVVVHLHVQPGAATTKVVGEYGDRLKVQIKGQAVEGKANKALVIFVAKEFGVTQAQVTVLSGKKQRRKRVQIDNPSLVPGWLEV
jgi:uncharacterized protein (TIGR00251 family)